VTFLAGSFLWTRIHCNEKESVKFSHQVTTEFKKVDLSSNAAVIDCQLDPAISFSVKAEPEASEKEVVIASDEKLDKSLNTKVASNCQEMLSSLKQEPTAQ